MNALSVDATPAQIAALRGLGCVRRLDLVGRGRRTPPTPPASAPHRAPGSASPAAAPPGSPSGPGYGGSAPALRLLRVDELHDRALYGLGVLVAHFDTGYPRLSHEAFRTLRIVGARDFVDGDDDPTEGHSIPGDALDHGQQTLSVLAGFKPGRLVGVAPGVELLLARTESSILEVPVEEDHWIAALEWADSLGADIVSSSLKFLQYDEPYGGYSWMDMDGRTARVTRAADLAARRGILVVNGAGNEGTDLFHNTLVAPADGHEVLAIGAVDVAGLRAGFSSVGPTTDLPPRIKPDLMAPGVDIVAADVQHDSAYVRVSGTSLACPMAAGVAALLLSVHEATPAELRDALRQTATRAGAADTWMGWGIIDAVAAYHHLIALFPTSTEVGPRAGARLCFANPLRSGGEIAVRGLAEGLWSLRAYDVMGRRVRDLARGQGDRRNVRLVWDGRDDAGRRLAGGTYFLVLRDDAPQALSPPVVSRLVWLP
jgi:subtilisin family serine protease